MSLQFILGSGLLGYAIGALIEDERREALRILGAEGAVSSSRKTASFAKYTSEVARAKQEAKAKYLKAEMDQRLTSGQKASAKKKAFEDFFEKVKEINRGLRDDQNLYDAQMEDLCVILMNLANAKKALEENPGTASRANLKDVERSFRLYAQGLLMPSQIYEILKRCYGVKTPPFTVDYLKGFLPNQTTLDLAAVPTPAVKPSAQPFALQLKRVPVATPASRRPPESVTTTPATTAPLDLQPIATFDAREEVATPGGGREASCGPLEVWIEGVGCVNVMSLAPTPTYGGGTAKTGPSAPQASPSVPTYLPTPTLGVRLGSVPLRGSVLT